MCGDLWDLVDVLEVEDVFLLILLDRAVVLQVWRDDLEAWG